mgnify:CR=1 FL=1
MSIRPEQGQQQIEYPTYWESGASLRFEKRLNLLINPRKLSTLDWPFSSRNEFLAIRKYTVETMITKIGGVLSTKKRSGFHLCL